MRLCASLLVALSCAGVHAARGPIATTLHGKWIGRCKVQAGTTQTTGEAPYTCLPAESTQILYQDYEITYNATHATYDTKAGSVVVGSVTYYAGRETGSYPVDQEGELIRYTDDSGCYVTYLVGNSLVELGTYNFTNEAVPGFCPERTGFDDTACWPATQKYNYRCDATKVGSPASSLSASSLILALISMIAVLGVMAQ